MDEKTKKRLELLRDQKEKLLKQSSLDKGRIENYMQFIIELNKLIESYKTCTLMSREGVNKLLRKYKL